MKFSVLLRAQTLLRKTLPAIFDPDSESAQATARRHKSPRGLRYESLEERRVLSTSSGLEIPLPALASVPDQFASDQIILRFADHSRAIKTLNVEPLMPSSNLWRLKIDGRVGVQEAIEQFGSWPDVLYAQPDHTLRIQQTTAWDGTTSPNDALYACNMLWGLNNNGSYEGKVDADIDAEGAWPASRGKDLVVAVIDTGVDYSHLDLQANMWRNPDEVANNGIDDDNNGYVDDIHGYDFASNDYDPMDDHGHGSHVAGTIAATANNDGAGCGGNSQRGVIGVAPEARIMGLKFLDATGYGTSSNAIRALNYAVREGATISNNSYGDSVFSQAMLDAINAATAKNHLFVAAAGNGNIFGFAQDNDSKPFYPASYTPTIDSLIAVAASDSSDAYASFSNYGATSVDLAAPGVRIWSTIPVAKDTADGSLDGYTRKDGTSMAAPHVAGAAALVWARSPQLTALQVKGLLISKANTDPISGRDTVSDGRLNVAKAVGAADSPPTVVLSSPEEGRRITESTSSTVGIVAQATDDRGVTRVDFEVNGTWLAEDTDGTNGWTATWETAGLSDGSYIISATATDTAGSKRSDSNTVAVDRVDDPPLATVRSPAHGAFLTGTVNFAADATDDRAVTQVQFLVDNAVIGTDTDGTNGWSIAWTTSGDMSHQLTVHATDNAANVGTSQPVTVTVDHTAPTVNLINPVAGSTLSGIVTLEAEASDLNGIQRVDFSVGGTALAGAYDAASNRWKVQWNSAAVADGSHLITTTAVDRAGVSNSVSVTVTTRNSVVIAQDGFESGNWGGGSGWKTSWSTSGDIALRKDAAPREGLWHARLRRNTGYMRREVNLGGATWTGAKLEFSSKVRSFEGTETALVRVSTDGTTWTTVRTFSEAQDDNKYYDYSVDLSSIGNVTRLFVAFDAEMGKNDTGDEWFVDSVKVSGRKV